ncbi:MAG: hypothetical protein M1837_000835 [Sclerophora amabilis]|nr:MAG: hypothetical protein M1837_000835 [Sclerophora amabilis]
MEEQVDRLVQKTWGKAIPILKAPQEQSEISKSIWTKADPSLAKYKATPDSKRLMIAISGIPGSGKTTLAATVGTRLNALHAQDVPCAATQPIAAFIPMDGYHLSRAQLSAMPDPKTAHFRRGAAFTFDAPAFLALVQRLREPLTPESSTLYAPSFDHAVKDPVADDIAIAPSARVLLFEGNYLSLDQGDWARAARLMDELWFVQVDVPVARRRLVDRHVRSGIVKDADEAGHRADESDLKNGEEIIRDRIADIQEIVVSTEDETWAPQAHGG